MRTWIILVVAMLATVAVYGQATETPTPTNTPTPTPTAVVRTIPAAGYSGYVTIGTASTTVIDDSRKFRSVITGISSGGSDKLLISAW